MQPSYIPGQDWHGCHHQSPRGFPVFWWQLQPSTNRVSFAFFGFAQNGFPSLWSIKTYLHGEYLSITIYNIYIEHQCTIPQMPQIVDQIARFQSIESWCVLPAWSQVGEPESSKGPSHASRDEPTEFLGLSGRRVVAGMADGLRVENLISSWLFLTIRLAPFDHIIYLFGVQLLGWGSKDEVKTPPKSILVLSDSMLPHASDYDGTQLPCSPSQLMNTDVAMETLKSIDAQDKQREEEASQKSIKTYVQCCFL